MFSTPAKFKRLSSLENCDHQDLHPGFVHEMEKFKSFIYNNTPVKIEKDGEIKGPGMF